MHLTFHYGHPTITDIVPSCSLSLLGPVTLPHVAAAAAAVVDAEELLDQTSCAWLNTHRATSVTRRLTLSDVPLPLARKGHASLH